MWLLTSGPTREHIDDVRFLSNASSGRMGHEIARSAQGRGHEVTLIQGPVALEDPPGVRVVRVTSARDMLAAGLEVLRSGEQVDVLVGVAAVCDWRPSRRVRGKPKKTEDAFQLDLVPNPDVLATLAAERVARVAIGFALQEFAAGADPSLEQPSFEAAVELARAKLGRKSLDAIVLNEVASMESASSRAWWVEREGATAELGRLTGDPAAGGVVSKRDLAVSIVDCVERLCARRDA